MTKEEKLLNMLMGDGASVFAFLFFISLALRG